LYFHYETASFHITNALTDQSVSHTNAAPENLFML